MHFMCSYMIGTVFKVGGEGRGASAPVGNITFMLGSLSMAAITL